MNHRRFRARLDPADLFVRGVSPALVRRQQRAAVCLDVAAAALADFTRGSHIFGLTKVSMIDLVAACSIGSAPRMSPCGRGASLSTRSKQYLLSSPTGGSGGFAC